MATTVTYATVDGTVEFLHPTITVTRVMTPSVTNRFVAQATYVYTIRALLMGEDSTSLEAKLATQAPILNLAGGTFTFQYDGFEDAILVSPENDLNYGPYPGSLNIEKFNSGKCAYITWQLTTTQFPGQFFGDGNRWVDFAYTISTTLDAQFYATRIISGILKLNPQDVVNAAYPEIDSFRETITDQFPVPDVENGFWQRQNQEFRTSDDNTTLTFSIVDRQQYIWLPEGVTDGDIKVETMVTREGDGEYNISGYFVGTADYSRDEIHTHVYELLELFYQQVIETIDQEMNSEWAIHEMESRYAHEWRSNRVSFSTRWSLFGFTDTDSVVRKLDYMSLMVTYWLALISYNASEEQFEATNPGAYGTSLVCGKDGKGEIAPAITIDITDKQSASPLGGTLGGGSGSGNAPVKSTGASKVTDGSLYISFEQRYTYKIDYQKIPIGSLGIGPARSNEYEDYMQQIGPTRVYLLVSGEMETTNGEPTIPLPPYAVETTQMGTEKLDADGTIKGSMLSMNVTPEAPTVYGAYKISWSYIMLLHNIAIAEPEDFMWPYSPKIKTLDWDTDGSRYYKEWPFSWE